MCLERREIFGLGNRIRCGVAERNEPELANPKKAKDAIRVLKTNLD
jgi:hypothetical protein